MDHELFPLAIKNFNKIIQICPLLIDDVIPSNIVSNNIRLDGDDFQLSILDSQPNFIEVGITHLSNDGSFNSSMFLRIYRIHCVIFVLALQNADYFDFIEIPDNKLLSDPNSIFLACKLSTILDNFLQAKIKITNFSKFY